MKFFISKNKKLPPAAQKGLLPRKEFLEQGKERFLAVFDASAFARHAHPARPPYVTIFFKIAVGAMAVMAVAAGVSAYADTANVSATSPLYPLKRLSENVRVALAPTQEKARIQATLAVRRADEIATLQASAPSSTLIPALTEDLDKEIESSLNVGAQARENGRGHGDRGENGGFQNASDAGSASATLIIISAPTSTTASSSEDDGAITVYCDAFNVSTSGIFLGSLESKLALHPGALARFNKQCGSDHGASDNRDGSDNRDATSTDRRGSASDNGNSIDENATGSVVGIHGSMEL